MFRHCFHVEFVDQQPGFAVDDGFRYAGVARCNDWQTGCGGLQNRNRGAFLSALACWVFVQRFFQQLHNPDAKQAPRCIQQNPNPRQNGS